MTKTTEADFFAAAGSPDAESERSRRSQCWYYTGMKQLFAGNKVKAADCFRRSVAMPYYGEYIFAQAELRLLAKN